MKGQDVLFSSSKDDWETPVDFFNAVQGDFGRLELDVCADGVNTKCKDYYSIGHDGLQQPWNKPWWCNPPYSEIDKWVEKAKTAKVPGYMLIPARTETKFWWSAMTKVSTIVLIKGRLTFVGAKANAPFPSALLGFGPNKFGRHCVCWDWKTGEIR